ncbi:MAG: chromosome condensation regulator RCC1, partial [Halieaceae bacterium]|nr:chromosome condensation regulator RCC1 [Halieaceae bacterium]
MPDALGTVVQVTAGWLHTCALDDAGAVSCWGWDYYGQCSRVPDALRTVATRRAGEHHTCALDAAGAV